VEKGAREERKGGLSVSLRLPVEGNEKLKALVQRMSEDRRLQAYWRCANVTAIDRLGFSDHGPTHVRIVANFAVRMLRMLLRNGVTPSVMKNYALAAEDAEVVTVLASVMHDLGMAIVREGHEEWSVLLALGFLDRYLGELYDPEQAATVSAEVLHAIVSHHRGQTPLTLEAGIVRVADALDMEKGRARIPFEAGKVNIHSVSAQSIERVSITEGKEKPITVSIRMSNSAGIFQVDELLRSKIKGSGLEPYIHVVAEITGEKEARIIEKFEI